MPVTVVWDPRFLTYDFGPGHPFSETSRSLAVELLEEIGGGEASEHPALRFHRKVEPAPRTQLERFHEPAFLDRVERLDREGLRGLLDAGDTPSFPGCFVAASRLVAGTLWAGELVRRDPEMHAFQPGGGLHHAHPGRASGFCIFNDVALLIASSLGGGIERVAYIDLDVHHGDGVMYGFYDNGHVLDIDFHQDGRTIFPGTGALEESGRGDGAGLKVNLPLPPGCGDDALVGLAQRLLPSLLRAYRPQLIVLQHGVDGHAGDRLGGLRFTPRGYRSVLSMVHQLAHELGGGRLVVTGGGGYTPEHVSRVLARAGVLLSESRAPIEDAEALPAKWRQRFRELIGREAPNHWGEPDPPVPSPWTQGAEDRIVRVISEQTGIRFPVGP